jgi:Caspase domain
MPSPPDSPPEPPAAGDQPRRFLIAAGASRYELLGADDQLPLVDGEVERITRLFARFGYEHSLPQLAQNPGVDALRRGLSRWCKASDRRADDIVVVYYSGHGGIDEDGLHYLLATDSQWDDLYGTALPAEGIAKALVGSPLRQVLVILDTCWAGAGTASLEAVAARLTQARRAGEQVGAGLWFIAAARAKDRAEPSVFVEAFTRAVEIADPGRLQQYLDPHWVVDAVNDELVRRRRAQRASCSVSDSSALPPFLPNPHHDPDAVPNVDVESQRLAAQRRRRDQQSARYRQDVVEHFGPRSRGVEFEAEPGWYFTGRTQILRELTAWLRARSSDRRARVVTGEPGSGKSAVLARLVTLADPEYRKGIPLDDVPFDTVPRPGSIDVAVHARRQRLEDLVEAIAVRAGVDATDADGLLAALAAQRRRFVVVIDALDEAGSSVAGEANEPRRIARRLLRPLAALPRVRLLVGARRPLLGALGPDKVVLDLDLPRYVEQADLVEYARRLLLADGDPDRTTPYQTEHALARTVATAIARRANRCFLVARIVARTLANAPSVVDVHHADWSAFPEEVGQAFDDYLEQFGDSTRRVRRLLAPLAYAEGAGLPREDLWPALASALSGGPCSDDDIGWLLDQAGAYIVEATERHRSVYRLYHQALVAHLRNPARESELQRRITRVLLERVPTDPDGIHRNWFMAHPYVRTYLAVHAAAAGLLDEFFLNPAFLLAASPVPLLRVAHTVTSPAARQARRAYQQVSDLAPDGLGRPGARTAASSCCVR